MKSLDIICSLPGSLFLLLCPESDQEAMLDELCVAAKVGLKERTRLNSCRIASMDMSSSGEGKNEFGDLSRLCGKLVICAGKRSHFEGLLLLNISSLLDRSDNELRLKALGEVLALPHGLASQCITVLYGPTDEEELLSCADLLDYDGRLRVGAYESGSEHTSVKSVMYRARLQCDSFETINRLRALVSDMAKERDCNLDKLVRSCCSGGTITEASISAQLDDPYSYINRFKRTTKPRVNKERRIGFHAAN